MKYAREEILGEIKEYFSEIERLECADRATKLQDGTIHLESLFKELLNEIYGWNLEGDNAFKLAQPCYDLSDSKNRVAVQITRNTSSQKVKDAVLPFYEEGYDSEYDQILMARQNLK